MRGGRYSEGRRKRKNAVSEVHHFGFGVNKRTQAGRKEECKLEGSMHPQ